MVDEENNIPDPDRIFEQVSGYEFDSKEYKKMLARRRVRKITFYENGEVKEIEYAYTDMDSKPHYWPYYRYDTQPYIVTSGGGGTSWTYPPTGSTSGSYGGGGGVMYTSTPPTMTFHEEVKDEDDDNGKGTVNA